MTTELMIVSKLVASCPQCYVYDDGYISGMECPMDCYSEKTLQPVGMIRLRVWVNNQCGCALTGTKTYAKGRFQSHECYD